MFRRSRGGHTQGGPHEGRVAQLVEHLPSKQTVTGSNPVALTILSPDYSDLQEPLIIAIRGFSRLVNLPSPSLASRLIRVFCIGVKRPGHLRPLDGNRLGDTSLFRYIGRNPTGYRSYGRNRANNSP